MGEAKAHTTMTAQASHGPRFQTDEDRRAARRPIARTIMAERRNKSRITPLINAHPARGGAVGAAKARDAA